MSLEFTRSEFEAILPSAILFLTGIITLIVDLYAGSREGTDGPRQPKHHLVFIGCGGALLAFASLWLGGGIGGGSQSLFAGALRADAFGEFAAGVLILTTLLTTLAAGGYLAAIGQNRGEFYGLLYLGTGAMVLLAQASNLVSLFVAVETLSLAAYVLAGFVRRWREGSEGSFKYFVMGAFSSGFLLFGLAFLYGATGSIAIEDLARPGADEVLLGTGMVLVLVGFAFKVGAVPFHSWVPDVYQGSPVMAAGWMAVAVKVASFAALIRITMAAGGGGVHSLAQMLAAISVVTMILGNLAALNQTNIKRMLAYSGIAHSGYLLIPVILAMLGTPSAGAGALFYLTAYLMMTLGGFTVVAAVSRGDRDREEIEALNGLARRHPLLAVALTLALISLAGIPLTGGFIGKLMIFRDAVQEGYLYLALVGIITSLISVYYYLRPVMAIYFREEESPVPKVENPWGLHLTLTLTSAGILFLGIFPQGLIELTLRSVESLGS
ncbi:MAG: NADH-quinone oxidoreductase subunit N [Planctomycetota bacterium]